jgi:acetolactate synthase-1/2/3 large subunit
MRIADLIVQQLVDKGITEAFIVTGGASMFLTDALGRHPDMHVTCMHHEYSCVAAAESYFRLTGKVACVCVTSGPGSLNTLAAVHGAYTDSMAVVILSGQARTDTIVVDSEEYRDGLRQLGDQECNIEGIARHIVKRMVYAPSSPGGCSVNWLRDISMTIDLASSGRPGPVWMNIPVDIQSLETNWSDIKGFLAEDDINLDHRNFITMMEHLYVAKRPVILVGSGLRIAGAIDLFHCVRGSIPVVTAFNAHDVIPSDDPYFVGRSGTIGDRAGNLAVQNADFLLILGCRCNIREIGYNWGQWAPHAYKVMVDIDEAELGKKTLKVDLPIHADLHAFLENMRTIHLQWPEWLAQCKGWQKKYPVGPSIGSLPTRDARKINPYIFLRCLWDSLSDDDIVVCANGSATVMTYQVADIKKGQRLYSNSGSAAMGWVLSAAIGAAMGRKGKRVICIDGDGGFMMNSQELATIAYHKLPIKIVLLDNNGYHSIRQTQQHYFPDSPIGFDPSNGVGFPNWEQLVKAYDIPYFRMFENALSCDGPAFCHAIVDPDQPFEPKLMSEMRPDGTMVSPTLDNMWPFLSEEERRANDLWRKES